MPAFTLWHREDFEVAPQLAGFRAELITSASAHSEQLRDPFEGSLEYDVTAFGGARKGKRGWGAAGKVIVFDIVKRNGIVRPSRPYERPNLDHERDPGREPAGSLPCFLRWQIA